MSVSKEMEQVFAYIDEHREEYIELLKQFISQPSVSAQNMGMREMAELIKGNLTRIGVPAELVETPGNPIVYGVLDYGMPRTITAYNHYDVVPVEPVEQWESPPFTPTIKDGKIFGRGAGDNKGSMLSRHCAVDAYLKVHGKLPVNMKFMVEGEEEIGSPNLAGFIKANPDKVKTDAFIWEGGSRSINHGPLHVALGVKGVTCFELRCRGAKHDLHSANAAIVPNPAWRLVWALNTMKNEKDEILIDNFYDDIQKPTAEEIEYLKTLPFDEKATLASVGLDHFINNLTGVELQKKLLFEPTLNIQGISAGYTGEGAKTVLPSYAFCKMDIRTVMGQRPERVLDKVRKHLDARGFTDIEIIEHNSTLPFRGDPENWLVEAILKNVEDVYGMPPAVYPSTAGSTGVGYMYELTGTPAVCFGVLNEDSHCHAPNEYIFLEDFIQGIKLTAAVINDFATVE